MNPSATPPKRGAVINPHNRFEKLEVVLDEEIEHEESRRNPRTVFYQDDTQSLITTNDSPDIGFNASINVYRGCEHGCPYCYARPFHEYLGFSSGLDFETKILVKAAAPELLRRELSSPKWHPQSLAMSGVTDCYQPVERKLQLTRRCLEVLAEFRNPVGIVTKNHLVTRDIDLLAELASLNAARVYVSVTSLNSDLARRLEPRASLPTHRLDAIRKLTEAGIPAGVMVAPVIPGLNDHEIPSILAAAREAGARQAGFVVVRLPYAVKDIFSAWLDEQLPGSKEKILHRIREMRGGKLNDSNFGSRMRGEGPVAEEIHQLFKVSAHRAGLDRKLEPLSVEHFRRPGGKQLELEFFAENYSG
ncbi:MAG TPA: PA0069 family radical SAM protein [Chthoniobacterales bacterium]